MNIKIDGKDIEVLDAEKNIVEICDDNGIAIPAPCFRQDVRQGCCKGCAVEIDGEIKYACGIKPQENMKIKVDTKELFNLRKQNIQAYLENIDNDKGCCGSENGGCSCSCDSGCC